MCERNINPLPPIYAMTGDGICNLDMCPDQEWNPQAFGVQHEAPTKPLAKASVAILNCIVWVGRKAGGVLEQRYEGDKGRKI